MGIYVFVLKRVLGYPCIRSQHKRNRSFTQVPYEFTTS